MTVGKILTAGVSILTLLGKSDQTLGPIGDENEELMQCKKNYSLDKLANRYIINEFCMDFSRRTCCGLKDTREILRQYQDINKSTEFTNPQCKQRMESMLCSSCEADMVSHTVKYFTIVTKVIHHLYR